MKAGFAPVTADNSNTFSDKERLISQMLTRMLTRHLHILALHLCDGPCCLAHLREESFPDIFLTRKVSVKENEVHTEKNSSRGSIFATKASHISN